MARAVLTVLILLVVIAYLSLFLAWNAEPTPITTLEAGQSKYTQDLPVGLLFIVGLMVGAVAMAVALWGPWQALKTSEERQRALVEKAKSKLKSQSKEIEALTEELEERTQALAEGQPAPEGEVALSPEEAAAVAATEEQSAAEAAGTQEEAADDDPEVI
jgi:hypothetical protein